MKDGRRNSANKVRAAALPGDELVEAANDADRSQEEHGRDPLVTSSPFFGMVGDAALLFCHAALSPSEW